MFRAVGTFESPQKSNQKSYCEYVRLYSQSHRSARRSGHPFEQSQSSRTSKQVIIDIILKFRINRLEVNLLFDRFRVCTTVAIAIVAETCSPFTVLPALMNEYRVPELNVQNGVLKSLSFLFEYIGEMGKDYIYAVSPLLEDALMDR